MSNLYTKNIEEYPETNMTQEELDNKVMRGELYINSIWYWYQTIWNNFQLPWWRKAIWINKQWMWNHGDLIIVPWDKRTSILYSYAMEEKARNSWLDHEQASIWASSTIPYKHEVLSDLSDVLKDSELIFAFHMYNWYWPWARRWEWMDHFNIESKVRGMSAPRMDSLGKLIKQMIKKWAVNLVFTNLQLQIARTTMKIIDLKAQDEVTNFSTEWDTKNIWELNPQLTELKRNLTINN